MGASEKSAATFHPHDGPVGESSAAQLMAGISAALKAGDMQAAVDLLHVLAVESPRDAALIADAIEALR